MIDNLTGLPNILGMLRWINNANDRTQSFPFSLMAVHLTALWQLNHSEGRIAGDNLLKWCSRNLKENHPDPVFRSGGDKFVVVLKDADASQNMHMAQRLAEAANPGKFSAALNPLRTAVIHFSTKDEFTPGNVLACLFVALSDRYHHENAGKPVEFNASLIKSMDDYPWMMIDLAGQMIKIERVLNEAQTDIISQLPVLRIALRDCEISLAAAREEDQPLSLLIIDGDDLRRYNKISYAAGDEAIRLIGSALSQQLRETDFIARYRTGDEFLILLRNTNLEQALIIAQRLCWAVEQSSQTWLFHTTISIGVSSFPEYGRTLQELIHAAEDGLCAAKRNGKNRVSISESCLSYSAGEW